MKPGTKIFLTYTPIGLVLILDIWAFSTGTYASPRDKILPYWFALCAVLYMLPAIIACHRDHSHFLAIWLIDLLGTPVFLIGWVVALVWAFVDPKAAHARSLP